MLNIAKLRGEGARILVLVKDDLIFTCLPQRLELDLTGGAGREGQAGGEGRSGGPPLVRGHLHLQTYLI